MYGGTLTYAVPDDPSGGLVLGNADAFKTTSFKVASVSSATEDRPLFRVAADVDCYNLKTVYLATNPLCRMYIPLENLAGKPLVAKTGFLHEAGKAYQGTMTCTRVRGSGTLIHSGYTYTVTNRLVSGGASLVSALDANGSGITLGNGSATKDPEMGDVGSIGSEDGGVVRFKMAGVRDVTNNVFASDGTVEAHVPGDGWKTLCDGTSVGHRSAATIPNTSRRSA